MTFRSGIPASLSRNANSSHDDIGRYVYLLKFPTLINRWKNNSLSNFLCKLVIDKQLISKAKQQNCYGSKNRENI